MIGHSNIRLANIDHRLTILICKILLISKKQKYHKFHHPLVVWWYRFVVWCNGVENHPIPPPNGLHPQ